MTFISFCEMSYECFAVPQFVGSFELGDHVYFFFREVAYEYTNCGKKIYSRVARVCKVSERNSFIYNSFWINCEPEGKLVKLNSRSLQNLECW